MKSEFRKCLSPAPVVRWIPNAFQSSVSFNIIPTNANNQSVMALYLRPLSLGISKQFPPLNIYQLTAHGEERTQPTPDLQGDSSRKLYKVT